jgi:hypothetical protein
MAGGDLDDSLARDALPPPPHRRQKRSGIAVGVLMTIVGLVGAPACLAAALLTANPCGPFGDQCADYGQTSSIAVAFLYGTVVCAGLVVAGLVMLTVGMTSRRRERRA